MRSLYLMLLITSFLGSEVCAIGLRSSGGSFIEEDLNILLFHAIRHDSLLVVRQLLDDGADVNAIYHSVSDSCLRPLHLAAKNNSEEMVLFLLQHGANLNHFTMRRLLAEDYATDQGLKDNMFAARTGIVKSNKKRKR